MKLFKTVLRWIFFMPLGMLGYKLGEDLFHLFCSTFSIDISFIPTSADNCVSWAVNTNKIIGLPLVFIGECLSVVLGYLFLFLIVPKYKTTVLYTIIICGTLVILVSFAFEYYKPVGDCDYNVFIAEKLGHFIGHIIWFYIVFKFMENMEIHENIIDDHLISKKK